MGEQKDWPQRASRARAAMMHELGEASHKLQMMTEVLHRMGTVANTRDADREWLALSNLMADADAAQRRLLHNRDQWRFAVGRVVCPAARAEVQADG